MNPILRLGALLLVSAATLMGTDLTITMQHTGKMTKGRSTSYWSANFMRDNQEAQQKDQLVDYQAGIVYSIDHNKKKIEKMSFDDLAKAAEAMEAQMAQLKEQMAQMPDFMKNMMGDPNNFSVTETGKETVAGRKCNVFKVVVAKLDMELSNDPTLVNPVNPAYFARFAKFQGLMKGAMGPQAGSMKRLYEEMGKLKGMTLKSKTTMPFLGEATSEAVEVKLGPIPDSVFALPQGYAVEDTGKKMLEQARKAAKGR